MNKLAIISAILAVSCFMGVSAQGSSCSKSSRFFTKPTKPDQNDVYIEFSDMKDKCVERTRGQINTEIRASMDYLSMAVYFAKDEVNRPGFAKLFFEAASEEREHAYKLMEYLSMRGEYMTDKLANAFNISEFVKNTADYENGKPTGIDSLKKALKMEKFVTESIRDLIKVCEKTKCEGNDDDKKGCEREGDDVTFNHYHFVDYLTGEFLEEQYKGQRDLAGKLATLDKMAEGTSKELAEFLFDKQLL